MEREYIILERWVKRLLIQRFRQIKSYETLRLAKMIGLRQ